MPSLTFDQIGLGIVLVGALIATYMKLRSFENAVKGTAEKREVGPQPFVVQAHKENATRDDLKIERERITRLETKFDEYIQNVEARNEERARLLHDRINIVLGALSRVEGKVEMIVKDS